MIFWKCGKYWSRRVSPMTFSIMASPPMNMKEKRAIALGAARSQLRRLGTPLDHSVAFQSVLEVLDDLHRSEPDLIASQWYANASDNQIKLFRREWRKQFLQKGR